MLETGPISIPANQLTELDKASGLYGRMCGHRYIYHIFLSLPDHDRLARPQGRQASRDPYAPPASRAGPRPALPSPPRLLRCPRPRPGPIRDGSAGRSRSPAGLPGREGLWRDSTDDLLGPVSTSTAGSSGAPPIAPRPQGTEQTLRRGARLSPEDVRLPGEAGARLAGSVRHRRTSSNGSSGAPSAGKKTPRPALDTESEGVTLAGLVTDAYEALRREALDGTPAPPGLGLALLLRRGVAEWLQVRPALPGGSTAFPGLARAGLTPPVLPALPREVTDPVVHTLATWVLESLGGTSR